MYKPQWEKVSSTLDTTNKKITVVVKGYAYKNQDINSDVSIDYGSDVDSTLSKEDITLFIDGKKVTTTPTKPDIQVSTATTAENATTGQVEVTHTITISQFEEAARASGIPYKEWSGNIKLKIAGRGKESSTYNADVLTDDDGNQNMMETDEDQTPGTWIDVTFEDDKVTQNTNGKLYTDFIRPEITYKYSGTSRDVPTNANPEIDYTNKKLIVVFEVIDKYFKDSKLTKDDITVSMTDYTDSEIQASVEKTLAVKTIASEVTEGNITYKTNGDIYYDIDGNGTKELIGRRYKLEVTKLEQASNNGFKFSGYMSLVIPAGQKNGSGEVTVGMIDNSGNLNTAKTITIGIDEKDGNDGLDTPGPGVVVDLVDPVWEKVSSSAATGEIIIRARDKFLKSVDIDDDDITVFTNGEASSVIEPHVEFYRYVSISEETDAVTQVANINVANGVEYKVSLGNLTVGANEYDKFKPKNHSELVLDADGGACYKKENGGEIKIQVAAGLIKDKSDNTNKESNKFDVGNIDTTSPEVYDIQKIEDATNDKLTFVFNVTDRNYDPSDLVEKSEITLSVDGTTISNDKITSLTNKEIKHESLDGVVGKVVGHQYTLVVEDFVEDTIPSGRKYRDLSGTVSIKIAETASKDRNSNTLNPDNATITEFIDYIKPEVNRVSSTKGTNTETIVFTVTDKYIDTVNLLEAGDITVYVDGEPASSITKNLTSSPIQVSCKKTINGVVTSGTQTVGHTYTLVLGGFEQTELQSGKSFMEWSGTVKIEIAQNAVQDIDGKTGTAINTLDSDATKRTVTGDHVDFIKPVVQKVTSTRGTNNETIVFNVIDKYLDTSDLVTDSEIKVFVDGVETTDLTKALTRVTANDGTATVNGTTRTVSQQYQLVLSGFEQASRNANSFKDWSGTVSIEIIEGAVKDTSNNNLAPEVAKRTIAGDFVDFIKPELKYVHQSTDINTGTKRYTMTFDITDKYYKTGELQLSDLVIKMKNGQKDASGNLIVYDLNALDTAGTIDLELTATPYYAPQSVKVTNASTGAIETKAAGTHQIGHTYTLTVSDLEKLEIEEGLTTANYSGIITVAVAANKVKDRGPSGNNTNNNSNPANSLTVGINETDGIPNATPPAGGTVVDVVDPLWTKVSSSAAAIDPDNTESSKAELIINGTDTYLDVEDATNSYDDRTLTSDEIEIYVNGTKNTTITPTITLVEALEESRTIDGTTSTVQYGVKYKISFTGFAQNANQVKVRILEDAIKDKTGNGNKEKDFIVYNVLKLTNTEAIGAYAEAREKPFLGESVETTIYPEGVTSITHIPRKDIQEVIFTNSTAASKASSVKRVWDVSAQGDDSIIAWTSQSASPYTIYIGSDSEIFANQDSRYLFAMIADVNSTVTEPISNIELLNTESVLDMGRMFYCFGRKSMTKFDLGDKFITKNVTNMSGMFAFLGYEKLESIDIGPEFDTNKVTNMGGMFQSLGTYSGKSIVLDLGGKFDTSNVQYMDFMFGQSEGLTSLNLGSLFKTGNVLNMNAMFVDCKSLASLNLGEHFNTAKVQNMESMFQNFAANSTLTTLDLGSQFYTSEVTNMSNMFNGCGVAAMTTLNLGANFDTTNVQNMSGMFQDCGTTALTSLDLGDQFYTTSATDMSNMFNGLGTTAMTILDLGPAFTKIVNTNTDIFKNTGKSSTCIVYAPESIYSNRNAFKLNSTSTTTIGYTRGTITPIYRPEWEKVSSEFNNASAPTQLKVTIKGTATHTETLDSGKVKINYDSTVTTNLTKNDIQVYINGELDGDVNKNGVLDAGETPSITKALTTLTPNTGLANATHTLTLSGFEETARQTGVPFKEWSGNISIRIGGRGEATSTYTANELVDIYGNQSMMQTDETGTWLDVIYKDADSTTNVNTNGTMFIDNIKPEVTYRKSETTIGNGNNGDTKIVTIIFDVVDKYFKQTGLSADTVANNITVKLFDDASANVNGNITKTLSKVEDVKATVNGVANTKIGEKYKLEITGLDKGDGFTYSGPMTLSFNSNIIEDKSGNKNSATIITINVDETDGNPNETAPTPGDHDEVDVVDPVWEMVSASVDTSQMVIRAKDKYFASTILDADEHITVYVNNSPSDVITKHLSDPTYKKLDGSGNYVTTTNVAEAVAVEYTITLGNITMENGGYTAFTPKNPASDGLILDANGNAHYRTENGGLIEIEIAGDVILDDSGNGNLGKKFVLGNIDKTKPEVYDIKKTQDVSGNKLTFVFNVTDRNYDSSNVVDIDELTLKVDGVTISRDKLSYSKDAVAILEDIDGTRRPVGHQYTLQVSNIVETDAEYKLLTREFRELSGTVEIIIDEDAANDSNLNTLSPETTTLSQFIDYIKPQVTYQYSESSQATAGSIDYSGKTFTMIFDVTDKYFAESKLTAEDLTIEIDGETPNWRTAGGTTGVTRTLTSVDIKKTYNKTVNGEIKNQEHVIGKRYTLTLEHLEQLEILSGKQYLDYSGVITVEIPVGELNADNTLKIGTMDSSKNLNNEITITSGIDIKGDIQDATDSSQVVDVVDPLWIKDSSSANAIDKTATIKIIGTDKYYSSSNLTGKIKVLAHLNGSNANTFTDITDSVSISGHTSATAVNKTGTSEQIGDEYTITVTGFAQDVNQIRIRILEDAMLDESGNGNKETDFILYNCLELTSSETAETSGLLGETSIQRQNIHQVIFVNSTSGSAGATKVWDVSAAGDNSIKAWYTGSSAPYTVYIGSDSEIFANQNSSYLFSNIGYGTSSTVTTNVITDLDLLNTSSVTNMSYMFNNFGHKKMTVLDLGNFDTKNVTNMSNMFNGCGQTALTTLDLGERFDTTNVTDMSSMFQNMAKLTTLNLGATGTTFKTNNVTDMSNMFNGMSAITTFSLGNNFNTENVENMSSMFQNFGLSLTTLTLGDSFYTTEVTNMSNMFNGCGVTAMTTLNLGPNFDTTTVQNMSGMFQNFAKDSTTMTTLDLGDKFYTTAATDMSNMFNACGQTAMTTLDLGPAFTKVASTNTDMLTNTGKSNTIIKAAESIYYNKNNLRLDTDKTEAAVNYTVGTIQATYKPIWTKISSSLQINRDATTNAILPTSTMTIVVNGKVDASVYGDAIKTITSQVTAGNDTNNQVTVLVDNETAETITQTIEVQKDTETEVQYKITLSNFGETIRQKAKGKNFLEWSGNVALELVRGSLEDAYGNKNMIEMDGTSIRIEDEIPLTSNVASGKMFADYIKPEFTYEYNDTVIGDGPTGDKKVKVVFDVTDKYFKETDLATDENANLITVKVDDVDVNSAITKELTKVNIYVMNKETKAIRVEEVDYTALATEQVVGERYELLIGNLESSDGEGYSGPMTIAFQSGIIEDITGNKSDAKSITIGIDEPPNHPEHSEAVIVDLVNPKWVGPHDVNTINRTTDKVNITILGNDKYYDNDVFGTDLADGSITTATLNKIKVYVDENPVTTLTKGITKITDEDELQTLATNAGLTDVKVGYILTLGNFGNLPTDISGITKIVIDAGTMEDKSGNLNTETTIFVGNEDWKESNETSESDQTDQLRYPAFRQDIVDFIDPVINYTYSTVEIDTNGDGVADSTVSANPDIDYTEKKVTVKFTVTDKYLLSSDLIQTKTVGGETIQVPKNINIIVGGTEVYNSSLETQTTQVTTTISEANIAGGKEYTLIVSNLHQHGDANTNTTPENGDGFRFSGPMQLVFAGGVIDDTSGNVNSSKTITLETHVDTEDEDDIVDVVDPIVYYSSSSIDRVYDRVNDKVTLYVKATDKYLDTQTLSDAENSVKVKILDENGNTIVNDATTITKVIDITDTQSQELTFKITLTGFGVYEGKTSVIIPANVIKDKSGNGNVETEILVGSATDTTAFKDSIVDFTKPTWEYITSSIERDKDGNGVRIENGTVTLEVKGTDIYFDKATYFDNTSNRLDLSAIKVYINDVENNDVDIEFAENGDGEYITETKELASGYSRVMKGAKYKLILSNFGTNEGTVRIEIPQDAIKDISKNGNNLTPIDVGNETWVEDNEPLASGAAGYPKYNAFRNDIVDYIKPVIKYNYELNVNPKLDRTNETVDIIFTATDTYFCESNIGLEDFKIYIDDMQVYGTGATASNTITPTFVGTPTATDAGDGLKYTLRLSLLELNRILTGETFERHSGVIKIVIAADQVADLSGNKNVETTLIVDNDNGDSQANGIIVDFVNPNIYYDEQNIPYYINWEKRYAVITLRVTDRFIDTDTELELEDITLYEENASGQNINITSQFENNMTLTKSTELKDSKGNVVGHNYILKLTKFDEEFELKINIPQGIIGDTSNNFNDGYLVENNSSINIVLDNKKPSWKYVSTDTSNFETSGIISFTVDGKDKFLDVDRSDLKVENLKVLKDGKIFLDGADETDASKIIVNYKGTNTAEEADLDIYERYQIDVSGLTEMGTYSLVFAKDTLVDQYENKSAASTISFSNSVIASNTGNYVNVTYHVTPDMEFLHSSYIHELMSVNTTGTNFENATYRPSTLGELFNNGENPLFAEPMYVRDAETYFEDPILNPHSFAGWAVCDEKGTVAAGATVYGLYDEIPKTVTHLKAVWQQAKVIFVSDTNGNNANSGREANNAVKDLATAYSKLNASGTTANNIIVIMDSIEYNSADALTGNATITSVYAGVDYRKDKNAELKISSNMIVNGDIVFDNIKLYATDSGVSDGTNYIGNGTYKNMLISNYSGDITIGRGVTTPDDKYTFGAVIGGEYKTSTLTAAKDFGERTIRIEAGRFNNIIAGSTYATANSKTISTTHNLVIGNMKDAAVSRNDKLIITGYIAIGENEGICYPKGVVSSSDAATQNYANITMYSGSVTATNKFAKAQENVAIYLRSINGKTDGIMNFEMYGGDVDSNIYGGARVASMYETDIFNNMKFYGGNVSGNIYGQSANDSFTGSVQLTLQGNFTITGNVFGGPRVVSTSVNSVGKGNSTITVNSSSTTINGNIYGGGETIEAGTGFVTGDTTITFKLGKVSNIYGSGYNCGNSGTTNITVENGTINQNIFGGAYQNDVRTASNITVLGGTVKGNIYGGNDKAEEQFSGDTDFQNVTITIGDNDSTKKPTIDGTIYGGGKHDKVDTATIYLLENTKAISVFGGANANSSTITSNIYLQGMTVNEIYGGSQAAGTVSVANIYLESGTATDVYGGGYAANSTQSHITLDGTATVTSIYGGPNTSGKVSTSNVTLKSGTVSNVFGGGNSAEVGTANVTLDGITIDSIHGGSKDAGLTTTTNVTLKTGTVTNVFGGGLDVGVTTANVKQQGATVTNIYGGNNSGTGDGGATVTSNVYVENSTVENVFGGNYEKGTTRYSNINIHGTSTITGNIYGGGYKSDIGKSGENGTAKINIAGGTINGNINGGSNQAIVYGATYINIGKDATDNAGINLTAGDIEIKGTIYGAGDTMNTNYDSVSVNGNTYILMDNSTASPITYGGSIFGCGNGSTYSTSGATNDKSTIKLIDFGTSTTSYELVSIERTGGVYIGNSFIELTGRQDQNNLLPKTSYTVNHVTNALTIYGNTTLYTQRGFNKVGGFNSYVTVNASGSGTRATTENVDNRLYTLEGVNLIFAKQEGDLSEKANQDIWGDVYGMTYFGMYAENTSGAKVFDKDLFTVGTYVEGREKSGHDIEVDGFYTRKEDNTVEVIGITDFGKYYDWIIGADVVNYDVQLIGSISGKDSTAELELDYSYQPETSYTLTGVSMNPLVNAGDVDIKLINQLSVPLISENADNTFGLTVSTTSSGWNTSGTTNIYADTATSNVGSIDGDTIFKTDSSTLPGTIKFKLYNSLNITKDQDLGFVNLVYTAKTKAADDGSLGNTFKVVIAVNIQTIAEPQKEQYTPSFTDSRATELSFTADSRVDISYILFKVMETSPYAASGDYRVLSTTEKLPAGTRITLEDYGQGNNVKAYYYHVTGTESEKDGTRYLYRLSNFTDMGSTNSKYVDSNSYYHSSDKYVLEKYDISIDFVDSNINTDKLVQETYLELRNASEAEPRFTNGDTTIKYNLYTGKNATITETIVTEQTAYSVVDTLEIPIEITASILEQTNILDTKYHDKIAGIAIQITSGSERIKSPELQNFKLKNTQTGEEYSADAFGVIRMPIIHGLGSMEGDFVLSIAQAKVPSGLYTIQVRLYTADDGKFYGTSPLAERTLSITFISGSAGQSAVIANYDTRIINKSTGANIAQVADGDEAKAIDMTIKVGAPTPETNIRVELYKRDATYTGLNGEPAYTGLSYTLVDIEDYLECYLEDDEWLTPSEQNNQLSSPTGSLEYMVLPMQTYEEGVETVDVEFEKLLSDEITTGEYKLVFKVYSKNTLVQEIRKTFIVTP